MLQSDRQLPQQQKEITQIINGMREIVSISYLEKLLIQIVKDAPAMVDGAGCSIYLIPELVTAYNGKLVRNGRTLDAAELDREYIVLAATNREDRQHDVGRAFYLRNEGLTGWIFEHGQPLQLVNMRDEDELRSYDPALHWTDMYKGSEYWYGKDQPLDQPAPFLGVPLQGTRQVFGVIKVPATSSKKPFPPFAKALFMSFAGVLSTLIRKTKLLEDLSSSISELLRISATPERQQWFDKIVDVAAQLIDGRDLGLYLLDAYGERIELQAAQGEYLKRMRAEGRCRPYKRGEGLTGWVCKTGKPLCIRDVEAYKERVKLTDDDLDSISDGARINCQDRWIQWKDKDEEFIHAQNPAFLAVPIKAEDGSVLGVLRAPAVRTDPTWSRDRFFDSEDLRVFQSFADSVALFLQSTKRKDLSDMLIELGTILDEQRLFQFVVDRTPRLVRARGCSILEMKRSRDKKPLMLSYTNSPWLKQESGEVRELSYEIGEGKSGFVASTGMALLINYYGPGGIQREKLDEDYEHHRQAQGNLVGYQLDSKGQRVGLIRLVGSGSDLAQHQVQFDEFVRMQQLKEKGEKEGLPSPHLALCETGPEQDAISFLAVPIKDAQAEVLGVIRLPRTDEGGNFSDEDLNLVQSIANRLTLTLRTLELLRSNQERSDKLQELSSSMGRLVGELWAEKLETRLETIVSSAATILKAEVCSLWQVKRPGYIQLVASFGETEGHDQTDAGDPIELPIKIGVGTGLTGYIAAGEGPIRLNGDQLCRHHAVRASADNQPHIPSGGCYSLLGIPLRREIVLRNGQRVHRTIGLLKAENKRDEEGKPNPLIEFTQEDESILTVIAETVVTVLDNQQYIQELEALQKVGAEVTGLLALDKVLPMLLQQLQELLEPEYARILVKDARRGEITEDVGQQTPHMNVVRFPIETTDQSLGSLEMDHITLLHDPSALGRREDEDNQEPDVDRVSQREFHTLERFVTQAAVAIRNAQLFEQAENRRRRLESLAAISARLIELTNGEELCQYIVESAAELLSAEDCSLFLVDQVRGTIDLKASSALPYELMDARLAPIGKEQGVGLPGYVAATGEVLNFSGGQHRTHPAHSGDFTQHLEHLPSRESHSILIVPLRRPGEQIIGVLKAENKTGPNKAQGFLHDAELLTTLANQAVIAISNAQLYKTTEGVLQRRMDQLVALREIDKSIPLLDSLEEILHVILEKALALSWTRPEMVLVALRCDDESPLTVWASRGQETPWQFNLATDETIREALDGKRGKPEVGPDGQCKLVVPIWQGNTIRGVLAMRSVGEEDPLEEDMRWLESLAGQIAIAVEREERAQALARAEEEKHVTARALLFSGLSSIFGHKTVNLIGTIPPDIEELRELVNPKDRNVRDLLDGIEASAKTMMSFASEMRQRDIGQLDEANSVEGLLRAARNQISVPGSIQLHVHGARGLPRVYVPYLAMREVLANLLQNAVQAIERTGAEEGEILVQCSHVPDQNQVLIEVVDTGCGFSERQRARLFEPLWLQREPESKRMGYALWWAKTAVTVIGGSISAESAGPDQGAAIRLWLPSESQQSSS